MSLLGTEIRVLLLLTVWRIFILKFEFFTNVDPTFLNYTLLFSIDCRYEKNTHFFLTCPRFLGQVVSFEFEKPTVAKHIILTSDLVVCTTSV